MSKSKAIRNLRKKEKQLLILSKESKLKKETVCQLVNFFKQITLATSGKMSRNLFRQEMINR